MKNALKYWWLFLLKGAVLILLSLYIFQHPVGTLLGLAVYIGLATLFTGIFLIAASISGPRGENWGWSLTSGILDVIFGFILLSNPAVTASVFPFIVGLWVIVSGIFYFVGSFTSRKEGNSNWWLDLVGGLVIIFTGYIITNNFLSGAFAITFWIGLGFFIAGVLNISTSLRVRKLSKIASE
jgi:uncharacterized membrane protein HdeD (DUF308 family)